MKSLLSLLIAAGMAIPASSQVATVSPDNGTVFVNPLGGGRSDDSQIQALVNKCQRTHQKIHLNAGKFYFTTGVLVYTLAGKDYSQSWVNIEGNTPAKDVNDGHATVIFFNSYAGFAFGLQQAKNAVIKDIIFRGLYNTPTTGFYTRTFDQWSDGKSSMVATAPLAAVVIDPFSDPKSLGNDTTKMYPGFRWAYIPGMSRSGSTAVQISNCSFFNFPVGVLVTAVNQQNGESCEVNDCNFGGTITNVAATQAQAKDNWVRGGVWWGDTHTAVDGVHWGLAHGDASCSWNVHGVNVAGNVFEFCNITNLSMPATFENITAENVWMLGYADKQADAGMAQVTFDKCKFDLIHPRTPPYIWHGAGTSFTNTTIRYYDNGPNAPQQRVIINDYQDRLYNCFLSAPPVVIYGGTYKPVAYQWGTLCNQSPIESTLFRNDYDSVAGGGEAVIHLDGNNATSGWYTSNDTTGLTFGTLLFTQGNDQVDVTHNLYYPKGYPNWNYVLPIGYFDHRAGNKIYVANVGINLKDGQKIQVYKALYKSRNAGRDVKKRG